jgi:AcrR family transcriptional regulator
MGIDTTRRRRTQAERREETRRALVEAADRAFSAHGFHGASLEAIAEDAGYSKGAVYGRFAGKDDLFLAVVEARFARRLERVETAFDAGGSFEESLVAVARAQSAAVRADRAWGAAWVEFVAHATRDPDLHARLRELDARLLGRVARSIGEQAGLDERDTEFMTAVSLLIGSGMAVERLLDPAAFGEEHVERLARAIARQIEPGGTGG